MSVTKRTMQRRRAKRRSSARQKMRMKNKPAPKTELTRLTDYIHHKEMNQK